MKVAAIMMACWLLVILCRDGFIGNIGLAFDKGFVVKEYTDLSTLEFMPYQAIMDSAVVSLENAITYAAKGEFELSATTINGVDC